MSDDKIIIFDTTLRDGEQSPGATMNKDEKLVVAEALESMGVDVIEAGFAIASPGDFDCVKSIAERSTGKTTICSLSRAKENDIQTAYDAIKDAKRGRIHTFISTSPVHMKHKLKMEPDAVIEAIGKSVSFARNLIDDVEWSAEDATRTEIDFLCRAVEKAIASGATTVNIPDTVGYTTPDEYFDLIKTLKERVPNIDKAVISVHCHDDLGMSVANSLSALRAGARQIECTINGLGERAGNAALEEIVMGIKTRGDRFPYVVGIDTTHISRVSKLVSTVSGFAVQRNKAIVGANAFAHESGIHQDGMLKSRDTYEIMTPESIGLKKSDLVLGKHSGRAAFKDKLKDLNIQVEDDLFEAIFDRFKRVGDQKKQILDEDIIALVDDRKIHSNDRLSFVSYEISGSSDEVRHATVMVKFDGSIKSSEAKSRGSLDAIFKAINLLVDKDATLEQYDVHALTGGIDAQAEAKIMLRYGDKILSGSGLDADTISASIMAYLSAMNRVLEYKE